MARITSALFLDFDNIFGGLFNLDRDAAYSLADSPGAWLEALSSRSLPADTRRDFLVRRAYLNPAGRIYDERTGNERGWLYFQRFRPNLVQAGFEVVDCPSLTYSHKNAADIRITIDVIQSLNANTRYDEFIVASSDADFTPLLQILRADDRRTTIVSSGESATAYRSIATTFVGATDLIHMLSSQDQTVGDTTAIASTDERESESLERVKQIARTYVDESDRPLRLADLGQMLHSSEFGEEIDQSSWFGAGSLSEVMRSLGFSTLGHYVWDPERHSEPDLEEANPSPDYVPESLMRIFRVAEQPQLSSENWNETLEALAQYVSTNDFNLTECTAWIRDHLAGGGTRVGRKAIGLVVFGATYGGVDLNSTPPPSVVEIRDAVLKNILGRAQGSMLRLTIDDEDNLRSWLSGEGCVSA